MAGKKIFLEFDIDGQDLKIAGQDTLSLTQQLKILKKELQKGSLSTQEFEILRKKIGDTEDQIAKTTTRSKDLFGVLRTIPGPIGAIAGQVSMVIDTLKVFSGFSFKDLKNSLGDILDDVKDITKGFFGMSDATKKVSEANASVVSTNNSLSSSMTAVGTTAGAAAGSISNLSSEQKKLSSIEQVLNVLKQKGVNIDKLSADQLAAVQKVTDKLNGSKAYQKLVTQGLVQSTNAETVATTQLTVAQKAATFASNALKIALASLGIGLILIAITSLVGMIYQWSQSTREADNANKNLNKTIKEQERLLNVDIKAIDNATKANIARAKAAGATETEIYNIQKKAGEDKLKLLKDNDKKIFDQIDAVNKNTVLKEEDKVKLIEDLTAKSLKNNQDIAQQIIDNEQARLDNQVRINDKSRSENEKRIAKEKETQDKINEDKKTANELLLQLENENSVARLKTEREREDKQLEIAKSAEEDKVMNLKISAEKVRELLTQIDEKYRLKQGELTVKRNEEDLKLKQEFQQKVEDLMNSAIKNEEERYNAERQTQYKRELQSLEEDKQFIALSEDQKQAVRNALKEKYANEDAQKAQEKREKELDDELRFLEIKNSALQENTAAYYANQLEILNAAEQKELAATELTEAQKTAIQEKYTKAREDLKKEELRSTMAIITASINAFASLTSAIADSYEEESKTSKAAFDKRKKLQKATAIMSTASGIIQLMSQPSTIPSPFDWIVKGVAAVAMGVAAGVQISNINATQFEGGGSVETPPPPSLGRGYATGGIIQGPGTGTSDSVPVRLSAGEAVMTANATSMFAPLLGLMNQAGGGTNFANNLSTSPSATTRNTTTNGIGDIYVKTYVVESELTTTQQKQARLKDLSVL